MNNLIYLISLLSVILAVEFRGCLESCTVDSYSDECNSTDRCTVKRCPPNCSPCFQSFKQIEFILTTLDPSQCTVVSESFDQIKGKQAAVTASAQDEIGLQVEEILSGVQKEVIECAERGMTESFAEAATTVNTELDAQVASVNNLVSSAVNQALFTIGLVGLLPDATVTALVQTSGSVFQQALSAIINQIAIENAKIQAVSKKDIKRDLLSILAKYINRIVACIKNVFSHIMLSRIKTSFDSFMKQLQEILRAGEASLVALLVQSNRKIIGGISYMLSLCIDSLRGRSSNEAGLLLPLYLAGQGGNPIIN